MPKTNKSRLTKTKSPRRKISPATEAAVLKKSRRRCALCFHLIGDLTEKHGQIAHLDDDRTNGAERNLAFLCMEHHSLFDSRTRQHKNYTRAEIKSARNELYKILAKGLVRPSRRARAAKGDNSNDRSQVAKQQRLFELREYVSGFPLPRIVTTRAVAEHLYEKLPKVTKRMTQDQIKIELYELEGAGVLKYHSAVDGWSLPDDRHLLERWKRY